MTLTTDGIFTGMYIKIIIVMYNFVLFYCVFEVICIMFVGEDMVGYKFMNLMMC